MVKFQELRKYIVFKKFKSEKEIKKSCFHGIYVF